MKTINLYQGDVTIKFDGRKHAYSWGDKLIPGVTTILKRLDKPALIPWAAGMASNYVLENLPKNPNQKQVEEVCEKAKGAHRRFAKKAADIGKEVHKLAEETLKGNEVARPTEPSVAQSFNAFCDWVMKHNPEPIDVERIIFSKEHYYAGTADFFGYVDGELCVLDLKTSSGLYLEMILQLAAYSMALEEELNCFIDKCWIIRLDKKTGQFQPYVIPSSYRHRDAFIHLRKVHGLVTKIEDEELDVLRKSAA